MNSRDISSRSTAMGPDMVVEVREAITSIMDVTAVTAAAAVTVAGAGAAATVARGIIEGCWTLGG